MTKFRLLDSLLYALLFTFVISFPLNKIGISDPYLVQGLGIILRALLIVLYVYVIKRNSVKITGMCKYRTLFLFVPFVIAAFSNIIAATVDPHGSLSTIQNNSGLALTLDIVLALETAFLEEIVFRFFIYNSIGARTRVLRIIYSAGIFALFHLLNLVNVRSIDQLISVLIQTVYTFGLGLLLGFIVEYSYSVVSCMVFHFIFNLFNDVLFVYMRGTVTMSFFYGTAGIIAAALIVYCAGLYFVKFRKLDY